MIGRIDYKSREIIDSAMEPFKNENNMVYCLLKIFT